MHLHAAVHFFDYVRSTCTTAYARLLAELCSMVSTGIQHTPCSCHLNCCDSKTVIYWNNQLTWSTKIYDVGLYQLTFKRVRKQHAIRRPEVDYFDSSTYEVCIWIWSFQTFLVCSSNWSNFSNFRTTLLQYFPCAVGRKRNLKCW